MYMLGMSYKIAELTAYSPGLHSIAACAVFVLQEGYDAAKHKAG